MVPVWGQWVIKWGKVMRNTRESSPQSGRRLRGGKVTGRKEAGWKTS